MPSFILQSKSGSAYSTELSYRYYLSTIFVQIEQFAIDLLYLEIILEIGTSCPPSITLLVILDALISGEFVPTKNNLTRYPSFFALSIKSILSFAESTVSKIRLLFSLRQSSLFSCASFAASNTASLSFQSPKISLAILSGSIYSQVSTH
jgi:hypothetical protein